MPSGWPPAANGEARRSNGWPEHATEPSYEAVIPARCSGVREVRVDRNGLALTRSFVHGTAYMETPTQLDRIESALARVEANLAQIRLQNAQQLGITAATFAGEQFMSAQLDALTAQVAQNTSVEASAIQLFTNLSTQLATVSTQLAAAGADVAALDGIRTTLATSASALAAAITANTPAEPPASTV